ncbi:unnamed protein product, partial [Rangifer tarandus platyrhynchus]
ADFSCSQRFKSSGCALPQLASLFSPRVPSGMGAKRFSGQYNMRGKETCPGGPVAPLNSYCQTSVARNVLEMGHSGCMNVPFIPKTGLDALTALESK